MLTIAVGISGLSSGDSTVRMKNGVCSGGWGYGVRVPEVGRAKIRLQISRPSMIDLTFMVVLIIFHVDCNGVSGSISLNCSFRKLNVLRSKMRGQTDTF